MEGFGKEDWPAGGLTLPSSHRDHSTSTSSVLVPASTNTGSPFEPKKVVSGTAPESNPLHPHGERCVPEGHEHDRREASDLIGWPNQQKCPQTSADVTPPFGLALASTAGAMASKSTVAGNQLIGSVSGASLHSINVGLDPDLTE